MKPRVPLPPELRGRAFTSAEAIAAGLGRKRIAGGDIQTPFRGTHIALPGPLTLLERCLALQTRLPENAFFSGITAAVLTGVPLPSRLEQARTVHVSVPYPAHPPGGRDIAGHSVRLSGDEGRPWRGLRISSPERLWCELAASLTLPDLVAAGDYLLFHELPHTSMPKLARAAEVFVGRRGRALLHAAIPLLTDKSESRRESQLRVVAVLGGIPVHPNMWIHTSGGYRYRGDLVVPERKAIIEYQSFHHESTEAYRRDMTRAARLQADGWQVMFVNKTDLDDPAQLVARIKRWLASLPLAE